MGRASAAWAIVCTVGLAAAAWAQPLLPPEQPPGAANPNQPAPGEQREVPILEPSPSDNFVLVEHDASGELIPLDEPLGVAAVWHVPMTEAETDRVREIVQTRQELFDSGVIRRFARALDAVRGRGEEPVTVLGSITNQELGVRLAQLQAPMHEFNRRGTLLNDPEIRELMTMDQLKEFGRVYRGWQGHWIAQEQRKLHAAIEEGADIEPGSLMPGALDYVRKMLEFEQEMRKSLFRQYRAGEDGFFDSVRSLDLTSEQRAEIDRIESVDDVDDITRFLRIALTLTEDQNRDLIKLRNPDRWEQMLLPPKLIAFPESAQPAELPRIEGDGIEFALVSYDESGRLQRLETEPDLAALRALDLPQATRRRVEEIVAEREAIFDQSVVGLAGEIHWISLTASIEEMTGAEMAANYAQVIDPIRGLGALMGGYYGRGNLIHDTAIKAALTSEQHAEMQTMYDNFARAYVAQVLAEVAAAREAGLDIRERDVREGAAIHLLRMKDFIRKARHRIAHFAGVEDESIADDLRNADFPDAVRAELEPMLEELEAAEGEQRIELFWDILTTLTPEQATRFLDPRLAPDLAPADG